ncbi:MAG: hypothetical protein ACYCYK_05405 [Candidatus Dormibacteria bacterium]
MSVQARILLTLMTIASPLRAARRGDSPLLIRTAPGLMRQGVVRLPEPVDNRPVRLGFGGRWRIGFG